MRTTLTLDDDVARKLQTESRRTGRPFREVVNDVLRHGLVVRKPTQARVAFAVAARDFGASRSGLNFDSIADLLEQVEGPLHR